MLKVWIRLSYVLYRNSLVRPLMFYIGTAVNAIQFVRIDFEICAHTNL